MRKIILKSEEEIQAMREGGKILQEILESVLSKAAPGVTTWELNELAELLCEKYQVTPSFKGYGGFPGAICASMNNEVVHGIPDRDRVLQNGDILSVDIGVFHKNLHTDSARTVPVGTIDAAKARLIEVTRDSFYKGADLIREGRHLGDVSSAIQHYVESKGYSVIRDLVGHGVGRSLHEPPEIPNFGEAGQGPVLRAGMTLALEPMVSAGKYRVKTLEDGWTVVTMDGSPAAHYEHTLLVTRDGYEIIA